MKPILEIKGVSKDFIGVRALDQVSFSCYPGSVHVLQGENGAGKSTILKIISGIYKPDCGDVLFKGDSILNCSPDAIRQMGIAMVYQELTVLPELTVAQNIFLNQEQRIQQRKGLLNEKVLRNKAEALAKEYGISIDPYVRVADLSVAEQQMVEILKALALSPEVLILDEPTSALAFEEVNRLYEIVCRIRARGTSVLFISHRMDEVFRFGDEMTVLKDGKVVETISVKETTSDDVIRMMVGRELHDIFPPKASWIEDKTLLDVQNFSVANCIYDVSLQIKKGEVVGIAALQGQGQTELLEAIGGMRHKTSGKIVLNGKEILADRPYQAISSGIVYVPDDRKLRGLCLDLSIRENIALESLGKRSRGGIIDQRKEQSVVRDIIKSMNIKTPTEEQYVLKLSGGNQQKVVIGKSLAAEPKVILFNEPTRGIDVEAKQEIYRMIRSLATQGTAILIYSSDIIEVVGMCDRVLTLYEGRITASLQQTNINEEQIMRGVTGHCGGTIDA